SIFPGRFYPPDDIGGRTRGRYTDYRIVLSYGKGFQVFPGLEGVVFRMLDGFPNGGIPPCNETDDQDVGRSVGGRYLGGIQNAQSTTGTGPYIEKTAPFFKTFYQGIDQGRYPGDTKRNGIGYFFVLLVHIFQEGGGIHLFKVVIIGRGFGNFYIIGHTCYYKISNSCFLNKCKHSSS